jgi:hypothetical protein
MSATGPWSGSASLRSDASPDSLSRGLAEGAMAAVRRALAETEDVDTAERR